MHPIFEISILQIFDRSAEFWSTFLRIFTNWFIFKSLILFCGGLLLGCLISIKSPVASISQLEAPSDWDIREFRLDFNSNTEGTTNHCMLPKKVFCKLLIIRPFKVFLLSWVSNYSHLPNTEELSASRIIKFYLKIRERLQLFSKLLNYLQLLHWLS